MMAQSLTFLVAGGLGGQGDTCSDPIQIACEGTFAWDNAPATTSGFDGGDALTCMSPANADLSATGQIHGDLFFDWTAPCDGDFRFDTEGSTEATNTRLSVHLGNLCSAVCIASDDDSGVTPATSSLLTTPLLAGDRCLIQLGSWSSTDVRGDGVLNITNMLGACPSCGLSDFLGCSPASPHYLGGWATLVNSSFFTGAGSGLHLECTDGPPGEFGLFLISTDHSSSLPIFNGVFCLDSPFGRYNSKVAANQGLPQLNSAGLFDAAGVLQNVAGTSTVGSGFDVPLELPFSPAGQTISPGDTWAFQCWFRDRVGTPPVPGSSANFSDSLRITF
tara:strand:+ start:481 stop:1479 length:999 start_codon:yes stop_codon:yes gene_type:complete